MYFGEENKNDDIKSEKIEDKKELINNNDNNKKNEEDRKKEEEEKEMKKKEELRLNEIKENLTCFMLKLNYIEDPDILLGYPIVQKQGMGKVFKIELFPIPELLTYDGFIGQIGKKDEKLDFYFDISFKSANNELYNYWIPIYIDKNHFEKNKQTILNSFSIIKYGAIGLKEYDFKVEHIFEVIPIILNKMIIGIFSKKSSLSEAFIKCYFQYILLFKKLTEIYKKEFNEYVNGIIKKIKNNYYQIDKKIIPDIGNFLVLLLFSDIKINDKIWKSIFEEFSIRQMYWIFHGPDNENTIKNLLINYLIPVDKINENNIQVFKKVIFGEMDIRNLNKFIQSCKRHDIYDKIVIILGMDEKIVSSVNIPFKTNISQIKQNVVYEVMNYFDTKFNEYIQICTKDSKKKIYELLINNITEYEEYKTFFIKETLDSLISDYNNNKVDEILKKVEPKYHAILLNQFFDCQKGNKLLIISYTARKKIKTKGFLEELEKNYGVLLNVSDFIKEIRNNLNEINSYTKLFEFVGCQLIKNISEYDYIIKTYNISKKKRYIKFYCEPNKSKFLFGNNIYNNKKSKKKINFDEEDSDNDN